MNRFVKNNMTLLVVLGASLCIAIGLLVFAALEYSDMVNYSKQLLELRGKVMSLQKKSKPNPSLKNIPLLEKDVKLFTEKGDELLKYFEHPLRSAVLQFAKDIAPDKTYAELCEEFKQEWEKIPPTNSAGRDVRYKLFQRKYAARWTNAAKKLHDSAAMILTEPLNERSMDELIIAGLGGGRVMNGDASRVSQYLSDYASALMKMLSDKKISVTPDAAGFSFPELRSVGAVQKKVSEAGRGRGRGRSINADSPDMPKAGYSLEDIPRVATVFDIIGDLVQRIADSGVTSLDDVQKRSLTGEQAGEYMVYNFTIKVTAPLEKIRALCEKIDTSYQGNRVYVIRSVFLYATENKTHYLFHPELLTPEEEAENAALKTENPETAPPEETASQSRRSSRRGRGRGRSVQQEGPGMMDPAESGAAQKTVRRRKPKIDLKAELKKPFYQRHGYGDVVAGGKPECQAVINIDYVTLAR